MNDLLVAVFNDVRKAEEVRLDLLKMDRKHVVDVEDAVILSKDQKGKVRLRHATHLTLGGAIAGGFLGTLFGVMLLNPVFALGGLAAGTAIGAVSGSMEHVGIDEDFMKNLAGHLQKGSSALCVLVQEHADEAVKELQQFGGIILRTTLQHENEEKLKAALDEVKTHLDS